MEIFAYQIVNVSCNDMEPFQDALIAQVRRWRKEGRRLVSSLAYPYPDSSQYSFAGLAHQVTALFKRLSRFWEAAQV